MSKVLPITEAIIEIAVIPSEKIENLNIADFELISDTTKQFEVQKVQKMFEVTIDRELAESRLTDNHLLGVHLRDKEGNYIYQAMRERLTVSKVGPYSGFEELVEQMKMAWIDYKSFFEPAQISRISTRYINKINLDKSLGHYLKKKNIEQNIIGGKNVQTYLRYAIQIEDRITALIQININRETIDKPVMHIDIDLGYNYILQLEDDIAIWDTILSKLRLLKNSIFDGIITNKYKLEILENIK